MNVICPSCMKDAVVRLDVTDGDTLACAECEAEFTVSDLRKVLDSWAKLLPWLEAHPARAAEPAAA